MCNDHLLSATVIFVVSAAFIVLLSHIAARHETNRRIRLLEEAIERHEQAQNRWVTSQG